jgi:hypothetical protein
MSAATSSVVSTVQRAQSAIDRAIRAGDRKAAKVATKARDEALLDEAIAQKAAERAAKIEASRIRRDAHAAADIAQSAAADAGEALRHHYAGLGRQLAEIYTGFAVGRTLLLTHDRLVADAARADERAGLVRSAVAIPPTSSIVADALVEATGERHEPFISLLTFVQSVVGWMRLS